MIDKGKILLYIVVGTTIAATLITGERESKSTQNKLETTIQTETQNKNENSLYPSENRERYIIFD